MSRAPELRATARGWITLAGVALALVAYGLTPGIRWLVVNVIHNVSDIYTHRNASLEARLGVPADSIRGTESGLMVVR